MFTQLMQREREREREGEREREKKIRVSRTTISILAGLAFQCALLYNCADFKQTNKQTQYS